MMNWLKNLLPLTLVDLLNKIGYDAKIRNIEGKIPSTSGLTTTAALTAFENKVPGDSDLVEIPDYDAKVSDNYNKLLNDLLDWKMKKIII